MRFLTLVLIAGVLAGAAEATAPPVGPLPKPAVTTVHAGKGSLVSVALPKRTGHDWRIARALNARVLREVSEGDVGATVVLVFKAVGKGRASIWLAETRGETAKAYRAVRYDVTVA